MNSESHERLGRLRWRSRRGLLELELLLKPFMAERLTLLSEHDLNRYEALLEVDDLDLYDWLKAEAEPDNPEHAAMVVEIRSFLAARKPRVGREPPGAAGSGDPSDHPEV